MLAATMAALLCSFFGPYMLSFRRAIDLPDPALSPIVPPSHARDLQATLWLPPL